MWRYRTNDNIWTWVSGSSTSNQVGVYGTNGVASPDNFPGARYDAVAWFDSVDQELWLFGGAAGYVMGSLGTLLWLCDPQMLKAPSACTYSNLPIMHSLLKF